jgi:Flp pilus assembly pilin Flp
MENALPLQQRQRLVRRLASERKGTVSIEYGLIALLVVVGMLVGLRLLGESNASSWGETAKKIADAMKKGN